LAYQALYRKWRPMVFDDVIGQQHITATIKNEILNNKISHAYLFTGTRGTGKTSTAKIFSRAVNCLNPKDGNPCNECEICKGILSERILDVIEIDAASNTGVDNIRDIIEQCRYACASSKYKIYIIDEVHMLSIGAFNALLKTLEEPPSHIVFILATTEVHKIPATILSRCQRFDFKTISIMDIVDNIKKILKGENISADNDALEYVAFLGDGSMRDSLSILDQCLAFKDNNLTLSDVTDVVGAVDDSVLFEFASDIADRDVSKVLGRFNDCVNNGKNFDNIIKGLLTTFRDIIMYKVNSDEYSVSSLKKEKLRSCADRFDIASLVNYINILTDCMASLKSFASQRTLCECALIKLSRPEMNVDSASLSARIEALENKLALIEKRGVSIPQHSEHKVASSDDIPLPEPPPADESDYGYQEQTGTPTQIRKAPASSSDVDKIISNWNDVMAKLIADGKLTLYYALFNIKLFADGDKLGIITADVENKMYLSSKDSKALIKDAIASTLAVDVEITVETGEVKEETEDDDVFETLNNAGKQFPVNFKLD